MAQNFIAVDREQVFLMPPSLREWLPAGHLAWFVLDAVAELDLAVFYGDYRADGHGRPAHDPAVMVALVLYAYAVGERSTRRIERRCREDVAFRVVAGNLAPDHATIARFLVRHQDALAGLFSQVLALCARAGLVRAGTIALDSTKVHANASGLANFDYERIAREIIAEGIATDRAEDELYGDARGDELPPELADPTTRRQRLRAAKAELEAEWEAERRARQEMLDRRVEHEQRTGRRPTGRPPVERDLSGDPPGRVNLTDRDSRPVKTPRGFIQGYNAHVVSGEGQIIIAADVSTGGGDQGHLEPMIRAAHEELVAAASDQTPEVVLADAGYWAGAQIQRLGADGMMVLIPPDGHARGAPNPRRRGWRYQRMRELLASDEGRALYRRRMAMIEPIFGQTKTNRRADRFQRRGLPAVRSEWRLITATHNLLKLWRAATAPTAA
jgi:transposase